MKPYVLVERVSAFPQFKNLRNLTGGTFSRSSSSAPSEGRNPLEARIDTLECQVRNLLAIQTQLLETLDRQSGASSAAASGSVGTEPPPTPELSAAASGSVGTEPPPTPELSANAVAGGSGLLATDVFLSDAQNLPANSNPLSYIFPIIEGDHLDPSITDLINFDFGRSPETVRSEMPGGAIGAGPPGLTLQGPSQPVGRVDGASVGENEDMEVEATPGTTTEVGPLGPSGVSVPAGESVPGDLSVQGTLSVPGAPSVPVRGDPSVPVHGDPSVPDGGEPSSVTPSVPGGTSVLEGTSGPGNNIPQPEDGLTDMQNNMDVVSDDVPLPQQIAEQVHKEIAGVTEVEVSPIDTD